ncbi:hypothetical protein [Schaalia sp. Marseille-Q2122]|uniref:hypothetical protein n=1 Tax=Schaalia sp. Marseille-Q2122 TaxID=2736604 RepID=UPI00158E9A6F|nr:hypothetical protein [Schaalia sp. Marseille-Q2122]
MPQYFGRSYIGLLVGVMVLGALSSCSLNETSVRDSQAEVGMSVVHQEGAPYPADVEYIEEILMIPPGTTLPEGAEVVSVKPAEMFAESYPGGWGYAIAFIADEQAIRDYIDEHTSFSSAAIDAYPDANDYELGLDDIDMTGIKRPWATGFDNADLVLERPLGRGWLLIRGAPR